MSEDFIGASDRFAIMSDFQDHRKDVISTARRFREIGDAMISMLQTFGYCPEVVDHFVGEDDSSYVVFECEEDGYTKHIILQTDSVTGEAVLHESDIEGAIGAVIHNSVGLVRFLTQEGHTYDEPEEEDPALDALRRKLMEDSDG